MLRIKRVYDTYEPKDGKRILIDKLWPRGLTKDKAKIDVWLKDVAPSNELRQWFGHDPDKWPDFQTRYIKELEDNKAAVAVLLEQLKDGPVTLVYAAKDELHNNAVVLADYLDKL